MPRPKRFSDTKLLYMARSGMTLRMCAMALDEDYYAIRRWARKHGVYFPDRYNPTVLENYYSFHIDNKAMTAVAKLPIFVARKLSFGNGVQKISDQMQIAVSDGTLDQFIAACGFDKGALTDRRRARDEQRSWQPVVERLKAHSDDELPWEEAEKSIPKTAPDDLMDRFRKQYGHEYGFWRESKSGKRLWIRKSLPKSRVSLDGGRFADQWKRGLTLEQLCAEDCGEWNDEYAKAAGRWAKLRGATWTRRIGRVHGDCLRFLIRNYASIEEAAWLVSGNRQALQKWCNREFGKTWNDQRAFFRCQKDEPSIPRRSPEGWEVPAPILEGYKYLENLTSGSANEAAKVTGISSPALMWWAYRNGLSFQEPLADKILNPWLKGGYNVYESADGGGVTSKQVVGWATRQRHVFTSLGMQPHYRPFGEHSPAFQVDTVLI